MGQRQSETNAPLFYAQRLMLMSEQCGGAPASADKNALLTATWLCLKESWECWLNELSTYMSMETANGYSSLDLESFINAELPEGQLLRTIYETPESWLSTLLQRVSKPLERLNSSVKRNELSVELIQIVSADVVDEALMAKQVMLAFKEYIESVRARQHEW